MMDNLYISKATRNNWSKLNSDSNTKLTKRANKTLSAKKIITANYLDSAEAMDLLKIASSIKAPLSDIIYTLCLSKLNAFGILTLPHVQETINEYKYNKIDIKISPEIWHSDDDLLGFVLQSLLTEGERNTTGQYYTNAIIVKQMLNGLVLNENQTFYDPCCGSGAFLLGIDTKNPSNIYGSDINPIAVMIAKVNLLCKYKNHIFNPKIYCADFLQNKDSLFTDKNIIELTKRKYDFIYTNPPWGADKGNKYKITDIDTKERASMFLVKAIQMTTSSGHLNFLLPTSLLKIATHKNLRNYILHNTSIQNIDIYNNHFDGVFTDYFSIKMLPSATQNHKYRVDKTIVIDLPITTKDQSNIPLTNTNPIESSIKMKVQEKANDSLSHSKWALGIVTGNNKERLLDTPDVGAEPIYTGKEVSPYTISPEKKYIVFEPEKFQQCAKEELYRAPEKLIYRFIANRPIVAYDNKQRLCLNSANILIPQVETFSVKSVAALLNSTLYQYLYFTSFTDLKVLKGNLSQLPFPSISRQKDTKLSELVDQILTAGANESILASIDKEINGIFGITKKEHEYMQQYNEIMQSAQSSSPSLQTALHELNEKHKVVSGNCL
ncbi:MAG: N-6 DNA methylase [Bacteroidales bacterium]|nr:N-6 DNA methylase [Bacteroidales bacterium]